MNEKHILVRNTKTDLINVDILYGIGIQQASTHFPGGLILMTGPEDLDQLMHDHEGTKLCHLYLQNNSNSSSDSDGAEKDNNYEDYYTTEGVKSFIGDYEAFGATSDIASEEGSDINPISQNKLKRNRESCQPVKQHVVKHHKDQNVDAIVPAVVPEVDETGIHAADINTVKIMATVSHASAAKCLKKHRGNIQAAIQELTEGSD
ncbi:hypothetical protein BS78_08G107900 [Paspalum vaginatum]|nr:hypothetical protein BS78_08G107900 [Paspalum vaginatum]